MQTTRTLVFRLFLCVALLMCFNAVALAQGAQTDEYPKFEIFGGFSASGEANNRGISFGNAGITSGYAAPAGFEASLIRNFRKYFGIKGDISGDFKDEASRGPITACTPVCTTVTQDNQLKTRVYNFLAGPEFKARNHTRFTPFAYALAGVAHTSASFTTAGPTLNLHVERSDTSFAMALGGGLDFRATKRVSVRASMDYNPVFVNDSTSGRRDLGRFSLGVLFH